MAEAVLPEAQARRVTVGAGSSFLWGMRVLPRARREAMYALYAFCRAVDDIADAPDSRPLRLARLADWRAEIARLYAGRGAADAAHPIARALAGPIAAYRLPRAEFDAVIDGMEMDAAGDLRAPDSATLDLYCRRVAGAVGMLSIRIFGAEGPAADRIAVALGRAFQLTNILRDLGEDAAVGRLYLPREALAAAGIAATDPQEVLAHPALPRACAWLAAEARRDYAEVRRLLPTADRAAMRPCRVMLETYRRLLDRLEAAGFPRDRRIRVPSLTKLWIALRHGLA